MPLNRIAEALARRQQQGAQSTQDQLNAIALEEQGGMPPPLPMQVPGAMAGAPMAFNPALEQAAGAADANIPMNPLIKAIATKLGLMNMVRNRSNEQMLDPETYPQ